MTTERYPLKRDAYLKDDIKNILLSLQFAKKSFQMQTGLNSLDEYEAGFTAALRAVAYACGINQEIDDSELFSEAPHQIAHLTAFLLKPQVKDLA